MDDGIKLTNERHPVSDDLNPESLEQIEIDLPKSEWVGLTDEEIQEIALELPMDAVRITEAKLKRKNGYAEEKNT